MPALRGHHLRETHEDKVDRRLKGSSQQTPLTPAVQREVELYNRPFHSNAPTKPAHYVARFFRRGATVVCHTILAHSPSRYIHTDELFDWMMPYERIGAWITEDTEDYINLQKSKEIRKRMSMKPSTDLAISTSTSLPPPDANQYITITSDSPSDSTSPLVSNSTISSNSTIHRAHSMSEISSRTEISSSSSNSPCNPSTPLPNPIHDINLSPRTVGGTNTDVQVNPWNTREGLTPKKKSFHPPFLILDCRRDDEYQESHIHGAVNIHYVLPKVFSPCEASNQPIPSWVKQDTPIITYCAVGLRSGMMAWSLIRRGYKIVKVLSGGYYKWVNEGRPIYSKTGELAQMVLQQHKLAGIMLKKEVKLVKKKENRKTI